MSDEFIKVATLEIKDEIASIKKILESCKDDSDIFKNSKSIEKHIHKIYFDQKIMQDAFLESEYSKAHLPPAKRLFRQ